MRKVRGMVWAEDGEPDEDAGSNLLRNEDTFPVTTGEGDLLRRLSLVPVPDLPRAKGEWTSQCCFKKLHPKVRNHGEGPY